MICQIHIPIKNLRPIFQILGNQVQQIWLNCSKEQFGSEEENSFLNKIELKAVGNILSKQTYKTRINLGSINTHNQNGELISSIPNDNWGSCIITTESQKDIWIPSTFSSILEFFPDEYFGEIFFSKKNQLKFVVKDSIDTLFDNKNIIVEFEF